MTPWDESADRRGWAEDFVLTRHAVTPHEARTLARLTDRGTLRRIRQGVYSARPVAESPAERHLELVRAHSLVAGQDAVFSHQSAAAVWGLPRIGRWDDLVHLRVGSAAGGRSRPGVRRHTGGYEEDRALVDGVSVTSLQRTALDLACSETPASAVAALDAAVRGLPSSSGGATTLLTAGIGLDAVAGMDTSADISASAGSGPPVGTAARSVDIDEILAGLGAISPCRGSRLAEWAIRFADGRSESPGESLSRVQMARLGVEPPRLQHVVDGAGALYRTDFAWPERMIVGEFDGVGKYLRHAPAAGISAGQAVVDEKLREDHLRRLGWTVIRWGWSVAMNRAAFAALLASVGLLARGGLVARDGSLGRDGLLASVGPR